MKKILPLFLLFFISSRLLAQVTLTTSPYVENFNAIGTAAPSGFTVRTGASLTALGTITTYTATAPPTGTDIRSWSNTTGAFKNYASATAGSSTTTANQPAVVDRALGIRQTGTLGDPGAAFIFQIANTLGKTGFSLTFDLQSLDPSVAAGRTTTWRVDYGFGTNPTSFTVPTTTGTLTTIQGNSFTNNSISVNFGVALDNNAGPIWIRIVSLSATTGSGNRASSAIDNFSLAFSTTNPGTPTLTATPATAMDFGNQNVNTNSISKSYVLSGSNLTDPTTVSTNAPFAVSKDNISFTNSISFSTTEVGTSPTVYVQFSPTAGGSFTDNVVNASNNASIVNVALSGTGVVPDVTPPVNTATFPNIGNITSTTLDLITNINESGRSYYVVLPTSGIAPSAAQVKLGQDGNGAAAFKSGSITNTANTNASTTINGLSVATNYVIYVASEDAIPNLQANATALSATTLNVIDVNPPVNASTFPKITNIGTTTTELTTNINEAGTSYYILIPANGTPPTTAAQVKAGLDGSNTAALKSGSVANVANTNAAVTISGLSPETAYKVYVVAQDSAPTPNLQTAITALDVTTAAVPAIIISQYYEGTGTNKWLELTNLSNSPVNTATPQLKLALYTISGDAGNINITATPSQLFSLNITIPARGTVLIGNTGNSSTEVPYLTTASAAANNNSVINFNGNDGIALLDANNNILDAFGQGINAKDVSYVRNIDISAPNATFNINEWTNVSLQVVQNAVDDDDINRLGVHFPPNLPPCTAPTVPATALVFTNVTTSSITAAFTKSTDANEYLIIRSLNNTLSQLPVDGTVYSVGTAFGGGIVANRIVSNTFTDNSLNSSTNYTYFIIPLNNISCTGGPKYLTSNILTASQTTATLLPCAVPTAQPTAFNVTSSNYNFVQGAFTPATGVDEYLVVMSTSNTLTASPVNQTVYTVGDQLGGGIVVKRGAGGTFIRNGLTQNTNYYFFVFSLNSSCSGGPLYLTSQPLTGSFKTGVLDVNKLNFYYGNLHSHSSYSDGNKDDLTKKPEDDYAFAKTAMKMDFLGISEHNHTQAGMSLASWQPGIDAAKNATTSTFIAMHGMEWGVISGGGHVIVYGIDSLIGWEAGENQIYVPKNTYTGSTGLFRIINRHGLNAIATLAHPNTTDYNNISATYNLSADSAIVGSALESGPAFSTNTTYSDPASSMSYLSYYNRMLAKGYHLGATIDHDNHNLTFGKHTRARLVVMAPALSENDLLDAIKKMRFYASEDSAAKVVFMLNKQPVGSIFKTSGAPLIEVNSITTNPVTSIKIMYGTPGSDITPTQLTSATSGTLSYTDNALANLATGYYYADIVEADGSRIITSPIWYTRDDATVKSDQHITFAATRSATYGDADLPLNATSDNTTINITYTSSDTNIATIVGNDIHIVAAGMVTITASQAGDTFYNPATSQQQVLTIAPKTIMVNADAKTKVEGTVDPIFTYTNTPALIGADNFTGNLSRTQGETAGDFSITKGTLALNSNYNLVYNAANLRIYAKPVATVSSTSVSVPVNSTPPVITFTAAAGTGPFTFTYNINGGTSQTLTSTSSTATVSVPTTTAGTFVYTVTSIEDANSTQVQNVSTTVKVNPIPLAAVSGTTSVCLNTTAPTITFTGSNGTAPYTFTYNVNGGANQTITTTAANSLATVSVPTSTAGTYAYNLVSVADVNASQAQTGTATVTVRSLATATISGTTSVSVGAANPVITFTGTAGTAPYTFTYNINGGTSQTVTSTANTATVNVPTSAAGNFTYNLLNVADVNCGQPQTGSATVTVRPLPVATITGTASVCANGTSPVITFTGSAGNAPYTFTYTLNGTSRTITSTGNTAALNAPTNTPGTFTYTLVSVTDANSSQAQTGTATVTVRSLATAGISGSTTVNAGSPAPMITFTASTGTAPYTFTYNINGGSSQTITSTGNTATVSVPTNTPGNFVYNLTNVSDANCGQAQTGSATVTVRSLLTATLSGTAAVCVNSTSPVITFTGSAGTAPYTFTYTLNGDSRTITSIGNVATLSAPTNVAGTFSYSLVSVSDAFGTQLQSGTATVTINPLPVVAITANKDLSISKGDAIILTASGGAQYSWTGADIQNGQNTASLTIRPKQSGSYSVTVTNASGCSIVQSIRIDVIDDYKLEAGTVITPNGDGKNDLFIIKNIDYYPNNLLKIFDKSGRVLYTKQGYSNNWDGTVNGSPLAEGTYYYILDMGAGKGTFRGFINIIRD